MVKFSRMFVALLVPVLAAIAAPSAAEAQASSVRAADAQAFLGTWQASVDPGTGALNVEFTLKNDGGNVVGELANPLGEGTIVIRDVSRDGDKLVLKYNVDTQGQPMPVVMTLTPDGQALSASLNAGNGMFTQTVRATRK